MTTDARFVQDVNSIVRIKKVSNQALNEVTADPITETRGVGELAESPINIDQAGIVSPLKEVPNSREYYETQLLKSSDGLFVIEWEPVKKAVFEDGNGESVIVEFAEAL